MKTDKGKSGARYRAPPTHESRQKLQISFDMSCPMAAFFVSSSFSTCWLIALCGSHMYDRFAGQKEFTKRDLYRHVNGSF